MMRDYRDNYGGEFPPEEVLNVERSKLEEARSKSAQYNNVLIDEFVDPIVMQLTAL